MHYHVTGYWPDDNPDNYAPHTLASAVSEMGERARMFAEFEDETARLRAENADATYSEHIEFVERYPRNGKADPDYVRSAMEAYRDAVHAWKRAETMQTLALNCQRFDSRELLDRMRQMGPNAVETSMLFSMGLIDGTNGYRVDTGELDVFECADPNCVTDYAEYLKHEAGWTVGEVTEWAKDLL